MGGQLRLSLDPRHCRRMVEVKLRMEGQTGPRLRKADVSAPPCLLEPSYPDRCLTSLISNVLLKRCGADSCRSCLCFAGLLLLLLLAACWLPAARCLLFPDVGLITR